MQSLPGGSDKRITPSSTFSVSVSGPCHTAAPPQSMKTCSVFLSMGDQRTGKSASVILTQLAWMNVSCLRRTLNRAKKHRQQHCTPHFSRLFVYHATHLLQKLEGSTTANNTAVLFMHHATHNYTPKVIQQATTTLQAALLPFISVPCHTPTPNRKV